MVRRISSSRPTTGSSLPWRASSVRSFVYFSRARYWLSASGLVTRAPDRISRIAPRIRSGARPGGAERVAGRAPVLGGGEQEVLGGDVLVLQLLRLFLGAVEQLREPVAHVGLGAALHPGDAAQFVLEPRFDLLRVRPDLLEDRPRHAVGLVQEREEQVLDVDGLVLALAGLRLRLLQHFLGLHGQLVGSHFLQRKGFRTLGKRR